jgi:pyridoxal phosphate enzyme (YggS family)
MKNICGNVKFIKNTIGLAKNVSVGIELVAVTKGFFCQDVLEAMKCGIKHIGESKIQEALPKFKQLGSAFDGITKHFIGRLQSNKVKRAVEMFDLIQSLDSLKLAIDISRHAADINKVQSCLIEVKVSQEITKIGVSPKDVKDFYAKCQLLPNILIKGLMVIMPLSNKPKDLRFYFRQARSLFEDIKKTSNNSDFSILSMGMSDDYKIAIEEGSTMVRIGSAIFGERDYGNK